MPSANLEYAPIPSVVSSNKLEEATVSEWEIEYSGADNCTLTDRQNEAIGRLVIGVVEQLSSASLDEADYAYRLDCERIKNTTKNIRLLKKRFGERFVKDKSMEGGSCTGGAREILASYMDRPGFANELKRLIPNKYGALKLLQNNYSYIHSKLEKLYNDSLECECGPPQDPYKLARSVGYELTGPFTYSSEFKPYDEQDFRLDERLCTFKNPDERLKAFHILWLRSIDLANTLPVDQLTANNLNDSWKDYLKTIDRYHQQSDSYNLVNLDPTRDDPYSTSSMSVQISRENKCVSIKNRYNSSSNTLNNNLDNIAHGLKYAVYSLVGREDLMNNIEIPLAEGYITDSDGGIHKYHYRENNIYYGNYEYIKDGVATAISSARYNMVSPQIYVSKSDKSDVLFLGKRSAVEANLEASEDVRFLYESNKFNDTKKDPLVTELRQSYIERDINVLNETLIKQAESSYQGYAEVATMMGVEVVNKTEFDQLFKVKMAEWRRDGVIEYLLRDLIEYKNEPSLLVTPNIIAKWKDLRSVAIRFGKNQPKKINKYEILDRLSFGKIYHNCSAEQLSGTKTDGSIRFGVMPSKSELLYKVDDDKKLSRLKKIQSVNPCLNARAPSLLDAITYFYTLRKKDGYINVDNYYNDICHFDIRPEYIHGTSNSYLYLPSSHIDERGILKLTRMQKTDHSGFRIVVG